MSQIHGVVNNDGGVGGGAGSELAAIFARRRLKLNDPDDSKERDNLEYHQGDHEADDGDDYGEDLHVEVAEENSTYQDARIGGSSVGRWNGVQPGTTGSLSIKIVEKVGSSSAATGTAATPTPNSISTSPTTKHAHTYGARALNRMPRPSSDGDGNADIGVDTNEIHNCDVEEFEGRGVLGVTPKSFNSNLSSPLTSMFSKRRLGSHQWIVAHNDEESSVVSAITLQSSIVAGGGFPPFGSPPQTPSVEGGDTEIVDKSNNNNKEGNKENNFLAKARMGLRRASNASPVVQSRAQDHLTLSPQMERQEEDENDEEKKGEDDVHDDEEVKAATGNSNNPHSFPNRQQWIPKAGQQRSSSFLNRWEQRNTTTSNPSEETSEKNEVNSREDDILSMDDTYNSNASTANSANDGGRVGAAPLQMGTAPFSSINAINHWNATKSTKRTAPYAVATGTNRKLDSLQSSPSKVLSGPATSTSREASSVDDADNERAMLCSKSDGSNTIKKSLDFSGVLASARRWEKRSMTPTESTAKAVSTEIDKVNSETDIFASSPTTKSTATHNVDNSATTNSAIVASASPGSVRNAARVWGNKSSSYPAHSIIKGQLQQQQHQKREGHEHGNTGVGSTSAITTKTTKKKTELPIGGQSVGKYKQTMKEDAADDVVGNASKCPPKVPAELSLAEKMNSSKIKLSRRMNSSNVGGNSSGDVSAVDVPGTTKPKIQSTVAKKIQQLNGGSIGSKNSFQADAGEVIEGSTEGKSEGRPHSKSASGVGRDPEQKQGEDEAGPSKAANLRKSIDHVGPRDPTLSPKNCMVSADRGVSKVDTKAIEVTPARNTTPANVSISNDAASVMSSTSTRSSPSGTSRRNPNEKLLTVAKMSLRRTTKNREDTLGEEDNGKVNEEKDKIQATALSKPQDERALRARDEPRDATGTINDKISSISQDNIADSTNQEMPSKTIRQNSVDGSKAPVEGSPSTRKKSNSMERAAELGEGKLQRDGQSMTSMQNAQPPLSQRMRSKLSHITKLNKFSESRDISGYRTSEKRLDELDQVVAKTANLISPQDDSAPSNLSSTQGSLRTQKTSRGKDGISNEKSNAAVADSPVSKPTLTEPVDSSTTKAKPLLVTEAMDNENGSVNCNGPTPRAGGNLSSRRVVKPRWQAAARKKRDSTVTAVVANNRKGSAKIIEKKETSPKAEKMESVKTTKTTGVLGDSGVSKESDNADLQMTFSNNSNYSSKTLPTPRLSAQNSLTQRSSSFSQPENPKQTRDLSADSITRGMRPRNKEQQTANPLITPLQSQLKSISNDTMSQDSTGFLHQQEQRDQERADSPTESVDSITCEMRVLPKQEGVEHFDGDEKLGGSFSQWQQDEAPSLDGKTMQHSGDVSSYSQPLQSEFSKSFETWDSGWGSFGGKPFPSPHAASPARGPSPGGSSSAFEVQSKSVNSTGSNLIGPHGKNVLGDATSTEIRSENQRLHDEVLTLRRKLKEKDNIIAKLETQVTNLKNTSNKGCHREEIFPTDPPPKMHDKILRLPGQISQLHTPLPKSSFEKNELEIAPTAVKSSGHGAMKLHTPLPKSSFEKNELQIAPTAVKSSGQGAMVTHRRANRLENDRRFLC